MILKYSNKMFAPQNQTPNVIDSLTGNLQDWYNACDMAIKKSDVIPGNYEYTVSTSYGNVGDIPEGSSTHFDISVDRFKMCSLENSYLTWTQTVYIDTPIVAAAVNNDLSKAAQNNVVDMWYVGYKSSFDAIAQYRIYSNSDHVQTQNHANYEWFMIYNSLTDEAKMNSDVYATFDKINDMNPFVPGTYIKPSSAGTHRIPVSFNLRIPLSSFLMLYNLKYFPHWAGKLTIEIYPSYKNLVICPVVGKGMLYKEPIYKDGTYAKANALSLSALARQGDNSITGGYLGFMNINQIDQNNNINISQTNGILSFGKTSFTCNGEGCKVSDCKIRLATYLLDIELANALAAKYADVPLIFPIQTTQIKDFTNALPTDASHFTTANTIALRHCDSMFIVFKHGHNATTCFSNPFLSNFRVNVDGKFYPREELSTYDDRRFYNLTLDALNINNNPCTSISNDLATSLQPFTSFRLQNNDDNAGTLTRMWKYGDYSNFMIGIPFCDSDDFMGGITTTGTVQIELSGNRAVIENAREYQCTAICFEDCYLKIRSVKPAGRSQIEVTNATIQQMALGGV